MARFNLDDYETVESRIKRFYEMHPDGRIITEWANDNRWADETQTTGPKNWVVKATIYLSAGDQANNLPKATGYAQETDGTGGANNVDALANAETSCIGRCLANLGMSGNKRASREEMEKVQRVSSGATRDWIVEAGKLTDVASLRMLWAEAKASQASGEVLDKIKELADALSSTSGIGGRTEGSVSSLSSDLSTGAGRGSNSGSSKGKN